MTCTIPMGNGKTKKLPSRELFRCIRSKDVLKINAKRYCTLRQAVSPHLRKEVRAMPITLTLHIFGLVFTIKVKSENRHPGR